MKKIIKYNLIALLAMVFFVYSCDDEDYTDYTELTPTSPTITVSGIAAGGYSLTEAATVYKFDVTLSEAQIVDIALYVNQTAGTATMGADYEIVNSNNRVYIPANKTTGVLAIKVFGDEVVEVEETFTLTIGDEKTANATITPVTVTYTIANYTADALSIDMTWETDALDVIGLDLDADEAIDLRMLILDATDSSIVEVIDGGSFENYSGMDTLLDGDYLIATDIYATVDAGDFDAPLTIDLTLDFYQGGVIANKLLDFTAALTNQFVCTSYRVYLANVTKAGTTYTFDGDAYSVPSNALTGEWYGLDASTVLWDEPSQVVVELGCDLEITGLGFGWMNNFWGESIIAGGTIELIVDMGTGVIDIPDQYYMTTLYSGSVQDDYTIVGSGTLDMSGAYPTMHIEYEMTNYGMGWAAWCFANGYLTTPLFVADITLDPAGLKALSDGASLNFDLKNKPVH